MEYGFQNRCSQKKFEQAKPPYKLHEDQDLKGNLPLGTFLWERWGRDSCEAEDELETVTIEQCDITDTDDNGIPSPCFIEKRGKGVLIAGIVLMALPMGIIVLGFLVAFFALMWDQTMNDGRTYESRKLFFFLTP